MDGTRPRLRRAPGGRPTSAVKRRADAARDNRDGSLTPVTAETYDGLERVVDVHRFMESNRHTGKVVSRV
ncbi:zinc-binding dehydrogenase [Streptomyces sp. NPDC015127]|uniref:zinc-binding dehydrogenase n=1 Tax=Streptomyces sp. NPDC015127 TaxID=3364939 RepID=UPI0036FCA69C